MRVSNAASDLQFVAGALGRVVRSSCERRLTCDEEVGGALQGCAGGGMATRLARLECNAGREQGHAAGDALD